MIRLVSSKNSDYRRWRNSSKNIYQLDESKILEESMYDGFLCSYYKSRGDVRGNHSYQQTTMGNRRKLQNHEVRIRGKACVCQDVRSYQSTFPDLFHQLIGLSIIVKETWRTVYL